jgi:hypothetical protein
VVYSVSRVGVKGFKSLLQCVHCVVLLTQA